MNELNAQKYLHGILVYVLNGGLRRLLVLDVVLIVGLNNF